MTSFYLRLEFLVNDTLDAREGAKPTMVMSAGLRACLDNIDERA
jgi:hypothetical protein